MSSAQRQKLRRKLLRWYDVKRRELPWRGETDPYRIWVSEVMLQQTRVDSVLDRYPRFLARFPTVDALADAPLEAILAEWQGLGYYSRARNLHRAARILIESHQGHLPKSRAALLRLPGFGPYMAGAVASIAFGERTAAVDGNVIRVMSRLLDFKWPIDTPPGKNAMEEEVEGLVSASRPGDFNQALMDLGAQVCTPKSPRCPECPFRRECESFIAGTALLRPVKSPKKPPKKVTLFQIWAEQMGALRLIRRKEDGLFGGMWELPGWMIDGHQDQPDGNALQDFCRTVLGPVWKIDGEIARIGRTLTHRKVLFIVHRAVSLNGRAARDDRDDGAIWAREEDLDALPISTAQRAAIQAVRDNVSFPQANLFN